MKKMAKKKKKRILVIITVIIVIFVFIFLSGFTIPIKMICINESNCLKYANNYVESKLKKNEIINYLLSNNVEWVECDKSKCRLGYYDWDRQDQDYKIEITAPQNIKDELLKIYKDGWIINPNKGYIEFKNKVIKRIPNNFFCTNNYSEVTIIYDTRNVNLPYTKMDTTNWEYSFYKDGCDGRLPFM